MGAISFIAELQRRNVVRAAVLYAASVWLLVQVITQVSPVFDIPTWIARWIVIAGAVGFPFVLAFAWLYELTPDGIKRERDVEPQVSIVRLTGRKLDFCIIGVLATVVVLLLSERLVPRGDNAATSVKSIAVLPLVNESGDKDQQYFSDGLSEDLISALSQFDGLKVISRNSSFRFRDSTLASAAIGQTLGVAHLLEGSVRRSGGQVRISVELVNAADGSALWSQRYDRPYTDLFKLQDDITRAVAGALKAKLLDEDGAVLQSTRPPSGNLDAYNAYLRGVYYSARMTESDLHAAIGFFRQAIHSDPRYALAYASLANSQTLLAGNFLQPAGEQQATYAAARKSFEQALALQPNLAVAHAYHGYFLSITAFDWRGAEREYRRALQLDPHNAGTLSFLGTARAALGDTRSAVKFTEQAASINPLCWGCYDTLARFLPARARYDEALRAAQEAIRLQPGQYFTPVQVIYIHAMRGDSDAAVGYARQIMASGWRDLAMALALAASADRNGADAALSRAIATMGGGAAYQIAEVYALRKQPEEMFTWLERARASHDPGISFLLSDVPILRYRNDPRFVAFCVKVGLPAMTDAIDTP